MPLAKGKNPQFHWVLVNHNQAPKHTEHLRIMKDLPEEVAFEMKAERWKLARILL